MSYNVVLYFAAQVVPDLASESFFVLAAVGRAHHGVQV